MVAKKTLLEKNAPETNKGAKGRSNASSQLDASAKREKSISEASVMLYKIRATLAKQAIDVFMSCNSVNGKKVFDDTILSDCANDTTRIESDGTKTIYGYWFSCVTTPLQDDKKLGEVTKTEDGKQVTKIWVKRVNVINTAEDVFRAVNSWCNYNADILTERALNREIEKIAKKYGVSIDIAKLMHNDFKSIKKSKR